MLFVAVSFAWDNEKILHINISRRNLISILGWGWLIWNYTTGFYSLRCASQKRMKKGGRKEKREVCFANFIDAVHMVATLFMAARGLVNKSHEARFRERGSWWVPQSGCAKPGWKSRMKPLPLSQRWVSEKGISCLCFVAGLRSASIGATDLNTGSCDSVFNSLLGATSCAAAMSTLRELLKVSSKRSERVNKQMSERKCLAEPIWTN